MLVQGFDGHVHAECKEKTGGAETDLLVLDLAELGARLPPGTQIKGCALNIPVQLKPGFEYVFIGKFVFAVIVFFCKPVSHQRAEIEQRHVQAE